MIHLFYCVNSMTESEAQSLQDRFGADGLRMLSLPCSGKMTMPYLLKAFETGADGVVICSCAGSECRNLEGNLRASKRAQAVDALLEEVGFAKGCVLMLTKEQGRVEMVVDGIQHLRTKLTAASAPSHEKSVRAVLRTARQCPNPGIRRETAA